MIHVRLVSIRNKTDCIFYYIICNYDKILDKKVRFSIKYTIGEKILSFSFYQVYTLFPVFISMLPLGYDIFIIYSFC